MRDVDFIVFYWWSALNDDLDTLSPNFIFLLLFSITIISQDSFLLLLTAYLLPSIPPSFVPSFISIFHQPTHPPSFLPFSLLLTLLPSSRSPSFLPFFLPPVLPSSLPSSLPSYLIYLDNHFLPSFITSFLLSILFSLPFPSVSSLHLALSSSSWHILIIILIVLIPRCIEFSNHFWKTKRILGRCCRWEPGTWF